MLEDARRASDYDVMVDWEKRLGREGPFFEALFREHGVRSVIDVGCGSGKHDLLFARWGLRVVGADPSDAMLAQARENRRAAAVEATFVKAGFGEVAEAVEGPFDALVCLGNALPHVEGIEGLRAALADFVELLVPDGLLVLHLLNHERLLAKRPRTMPPTLRRTDEGERVFLKVLSYPEDGSGILFDFLTLTRVSEDVGEVTRPARKGDPGDPERDEGGWMLQARRSMHTALPVSLLAPELASAGFGDIIAYGAHDGSPLEPLEHESVILTARGPIV